MCKALLAALSAEGIVIPMREISAEGVVSCPACVLLMASDMGWLADGHGSSG